MRQTFDQGRAAATPAAETREARFALGGHIQRGDMAPWWRQERHRFIFDQVAGRWIILGFRGDQGRPLAPRDLEALSELRSVLGAEALAVFWVSADPTDRPDTPGPDPAIRFVWDADRQMSRAYGVADRGLWLVLDPMLRVTEAILIGPDGPAILALRPALECAALQRRRAETPAPVLILPDVFEEGFCRHLVGLHEAAGGGRESGFMQEVAGRAVERHDPAWKRRRDLILEDETLTGHVKARVARRIAPMLRRAFHFQLTRMERHLIACYSADDGGHFGPHRDDTVQATEHRRFAASINLNDDFGGGELCFPEFGGRLYKAPVGAALVFSGSLLHEVRKVTRGRRYAFLPFLHDEEAERIRMANLQPQRPPP
jgi:predicted 2-oxoglutarate/Fe(II)-dependent dioxygenase YbiX